MYPKRESQSSHIGGGERYPPNRRWHGDDGKVQRQRWRRRVRHNANIKNLSWARRKLEEWQKKISKSGITRWKINRADFLTIATMVRRMGYTKLGKGMAGYAEKNVDAESKGGLMFADLSDLKRLLAIKPFGAEPLPDFLR